MLVRGGIVADGSGADPSLANVRFAGDLFTEVADKLTPHVGETVIVASGLLVTPGIVDVHTHYDGQATWGEQLGLRRDLRRRCTNHRP